MFKDVCEESLSQHRRLFGFHSPLSEAHGLSVLRFSGQEGLSQLFLFSLELISAQANIELKTLTGKNVALSICLADGRFRYINAYVCDVTHVGADAGVANYQAELAPWLWMLGQRQNCRIFQGKTTEQIVRDVFAAYPGLADYEFRLTEPLKPISYCTQYQESDLDFVLRLLESEGLFFMFEHTRDAHCMVIFDDSCECEPLATQPVIRYHRASVTETEDSITAWSATRRLHPTRLAYTSFDYKQPRNPGEVGLNTVSEQGDVGRHEVYAYAGPYGYATHEQGLNKARHRLQAMEARGKVFDGASHCRAMAPGFAFELSQHYDHDYDTPQDRQFLLLSVSHWGQNNCSGQEHATYRNTFTCIRRKIPFRPPLSTPRPSIVGPQTAFVVGPPGEEIFTDTLGRVKLQFHWDRNGQYNDGSSCWVRVAQASASGGFGSIHIPRVGDEVVVVFLDGNPDRPLVIGSLYNSLNLPPWALPANKTQSGVLTRSIKGNRTNASSLRFDDKAGAEQVSLHAERNFETAVEVDEHHWVGRDRSVKVEGNQRELIRLDADVAVEEGSYRVCVNQGAVTISAATSITLEVGASSLVMNADGTIRLAGVVVDVAGSAVINLN